MVKSSRKSARTNPSDVGELLRREIEEVIARHSRSTGSYETAVPGLNVARITRPVPPTTHLSDASVCVCVRGAREVAVGDHVWSQGEDWFLLSAIGSPAIVTITDASPEHPYTALRIDLDLDLARQVMADIDIQGAAEVIASSSQLGRVDRAFLDAVARLVRLIESPDDVSFMSSLIHRELLYRLLSGPSGHRLRQIVRLGSQGHRIARAVAWLRSHYQDRLRIEDLASIAGMGVSTLHRHFHDLTGMSPIQYQKHLRLHEARRRLLDDDADVGTTALGVGYESPTQFIREYRRLFGEPPLRDVRALRARGGSPSLV
ncbi:AraC family transcriptional regulator [Xanthobacter sp. VNH20]|uniref:AraC family transcriptional regulator n=1 Tax=Xanthobacter sp. VNH20 TaxID=3156616 RepID=UPI0032B60841